MRLEQCKTLDTGRRVQGFLDAQAAVVGKQVGAVIRKRLDDAVAELAACQIEQSRTADIALSETSIQVTIRRDLYRAYLRPIGRIARRKLRGVPEYESLLVQSPSNARYGDFEAQVMAAARAAAIHEQVLVDHGMPVDFVAGLEEGIARLARSTTKRSDQQVRRSTATAGLATMKRAISDIVFVLDHVLTPALESDAAVLAGWKAASRFHRTAVTPLREESVTVQGTIKVAA